VQGGDHYGARKASPVPIAAKGHSSLTAAPNGLPATRCLAMSGMDTAIMTSPDMAALTVSHHHACYLGATTPGPQQQLEDNTVLTRSQSGGQHVDEPEVRDDDVAHPVHNGVS
jgi:hypothetical protein